MHYYAIQTDAGVRHWHADTLEHALEQHYDALVDDMVPNDPEGFIWDAFEDDDAHEDDCACGGLDNS